MIKEAKRELEKYFDSNRWKVIDNGDESLFYKNRDPLNIKEHEFLGYSKKKNILQASDVINYIKEIFMQRGYEQRESEPIIRPKESSTFFTTSGVQAFEYELLNGEPMNMTNSLFIQPVIRTNYARNLREGSVSSFVNPSTVRFGGNSTQYVEDLDGWMKILSGMGLYLGDFIFKLKEKKGDINSSNPWKRNSGFSVSCSYGGLGLGVAGYYLSSETGSSFADIGFGLERLLWARNKNATFREVVGTLPYSFNQGIETIDAIRSLSLMSMFDIDSNKDASNQFRKYLLKIDRDCSDVESQFRSAHKFWRQFITPEKEEYEAVSHLMRNINKVRNMDSLVRVGIPSVPKELTRMVSHDENTFLRELIKLRQWIAPSIKNIYKKV